MANHLIIYMHPTRDSFNGALLRTYESALVKLGEHVVVRRLYELNFDPLLTQTEYEESFHGMYRQDVKAEHEYIEAADVITLVFPVWWAGLPALGKGYIDRVFSYRFAYELDGECPIPKLTGKKVATICTSGTPKEEYQQTGMLKSIYQTLGDGIFSFCGLEVIDHLHFGNVVLASRTEYEQMFAAADAFAKKISKSVGRRETND
ncbi:NAD(P)H-dependent oxidoreductase [Desertibacillus haloalkaliphilus]|uniref:NAD(P)H-dependent oxidoreductase n=1 Tax=Desertibacillus haloalkaliphilus TaxID=1328930 RepID=UPI001C279C45|nr:NAD(P)H-dependent oxidoreductase [Desertibacillus haloalkaliphilus]MBU8904983.1 NAD(P)H-dependent oxidoreductase [Desertibacillus haloalkaliphilus]